MYKHDLALNKRQKQPTNDQKQPTNQRFFLFHGISTFKKAKLNYF